MPCHPIQLLSAISQVCITTVMHLHKALFHSNHVGLFIDILRGARSTTSRIRMALDKRKEFYKSIRSTSKSHRKSTGKSAGKNTRKSQSHDDSAQLIPGFDQFRSGMESHDNKKAVQLFIPFWTKSLLFYDLNMSSADPLRFAFPDAIKMSSSERLVWIQSTASNQCAPLLISSPLHRAMIDIPSDSNASAAHVSVPRPKRAYNKVDHNVHQERENDGKIISRSKFYHSHEKTRFTAAMAIINPAVASSQCAIECDSDALSPEALSTTAVPFVPPIALPSLSPIALPSFSPLTGYNLHLPQLHVHSSPLRSAPAQQAQDEVVFRQLSTILAADDHCDGRGEVSVTHEKRQYQVQLLSESTHGVESVKQMNAVYRTLMQTTVHAAPRIYGLVPVTILQPEKKIRYGFVMERPCGAFVMDMMNAEPMCPDGSANPLSLRAYTVLQRVCLAIQFLDAVMTIRRLNIDQRGLSPFGVTVMSPAILARLNSTSSATESDPALLSQASASSTSAATAAASSLSSPFDRVVLTSFCNSVVTSDAASSSLAAVSNQSDSEGAYKEESVFKQLRAQYPELCVNAANQYNAHDLFSCGVMVFDIIRGRSMVPHTDCPTSITDSRIALFKHLSSASNANLNRTSLVEVFMRYERVHMADNDAEVPQSDEGEVPKSLDVDMECLVRAHYDPAQSPSSSSNASSQFNFVNANREAADLLDKHLPLRNALIESTRMRRHADASTTFKDISDSIDRITAALRPCHHELVLTSPSGIAAKLVRLGLEEVTIERDGNCMYNTFIQQGSVHNRSDISSLTVAQVREAAHSHIVTNIDDLLKFQAGSTEAVSEASKAAFLAEMAPVLEGTKWNTDSSDIVLQVLAQSYKVDIRIIDKTRGDEKNDHTIAFNDEQHDHDPSTFFCFLRSPSHYDGSRISM